MIGIFEALDWLNAIDGNSCLTDRERGLSMAARVVSNSEEEVRRILANLRDAGQSSSDPFERAEVVLHLAAVEYGHEWFPEAAQDVIGAVRAYSNDTHRLAVAQWILGMVQWRILQNIEAYTNWSNARKIFQERQTALQNRPNLIDWYQAWVWQMELELTAKPEEIINWLNRFEDPRLTRAPRLMANSIAENLRQRRYPDVYALIRDIQQVSRWSTVIYERAEVCFECGLAAYQMGNLDFAFELNETNYFLRFSSTRFRWIHARISPFLQFQNRIYFLVSFSEKGSAGFRPGHRKQS